MEKTYFSAPHLCVKRGNAFNKASRMDANGIPASSRSGKKKIHIIRNGPAENAAQQAWENQA